MAMATRSKPGVAANPLNQQPDDPGRATVLVDQPMNEA